MKTDIQKKMNLLRKQIAQYAEDYYTHDNLTVEDAVYDSLVRDLKKLDQDFPEYADYNFIIYRVGGKPLDVFSKVEHTTRMLSLNDSFSFEEILDWKKRIEKILPQSTKYNLFAELKLDGLAVSLTYKQGILVQAATRGDGFVGEDITENAKMINDIPLKLEAPYPYSIEIRGEVIMQKKVFDAINNKQKNKGLPIFANTRNAAAGSLRQLDPKIVKERNLSFFAYDFVQLDSTFIHQPKTHSDKHKIIKDLGFIIPEYDLQVNSIEKLPDFFQKIKEIREKLPFHIDGIVVCVNELILQEKLGVVGKAPRYAIAYKYPAEKVTTHILSISVHVGRTGVLTPVAHFNQTLVAGSRVSKATLHNIDQIKRLDLKIGDTIVLQKAGDVIPEVVEVLKEFRTGNEKIFVMPKKCPVCGGEVFQKKGIGNELSVAFFCSNDLCPAKNTRKIVHFVSIMQIYEVGPKIIERLQEEGLISDAADLYLLTEADMSGLERFGEKSAQNIIEAINKTKNPPLDRFIAALGIPNIGVETAYDLASKFGTFEKFWSSQIQDLNSIDQIGPVIVDSILEYKNNNTSKKFVEKLRTEAQLLPQPFIKKQKGIFDNQTFVLTGTLTDFSRDQIKKFIKDNGGIVSSSVSKKTDFVLIGESPGSKYKDAQKIGVKIIDQTQFLKMAKGLL